MKLFVQDDLILIYCVCVFLDNSFAAVLNAHEIVVEKAAYSLLHITGRVILLYQHFALEVDFISFLKSINAIDNIHCLAKLLKL